MTLADRPNIVLLLVDDMGFSDVGCFGGEIDTPHLDRLGYNGVRCTQFYNAARCCPTRASMLTGLHPHQAGVGHMVGWGASEAYRGRLNDRCITIAEALRSSGYATYMSGKWHVGGAYDMQDPGSWRRVAGDPRHPTPIQRGFDRHYGILTGACSYWNPATLVDNDRFCDPPGEGYYLTDALTDAAMGMIDHAAEGDRPFFLYWAPTAPHWPLHAWPKDIDKYRGRYDAGWDDLRAARYHRQRELGIVDNRWPLSPRDEQSHDWSKAEDPAWESLRMAVYAAQMDNLDQNVGRVLDRLEAHGMFENTLFIFLSDNGACAEFLREDAETHEWPGNYALPTADGRDVVRVGNRLDLEPGPDGTFMSYDLPWANASNTPFRKFKCWTHEGGIATPLLAHWPAAMPGGAVLDGVGHVIDLMPTILHAARATYPRQHRGRDILPPEGRSLLDAWTRGETWRRQDPLYWSHQSCKAVRDGEWKLVQGEGPDAAWELYDMAADRTELHDLAADRPGVADRLSKRWQHWAERVGV